MISVTDDPDAANDQFEVGSVTFFFSSMVFRPSMKEKLRQGVTLVVDRYAFSGVAFTSAKEVSEGPGRPCLSLYLEKQEMERGLLSRSDCVAQAPFLEKCGLKWGMKVST